VDFVPNSFGSLGDFGIMTALVGAPLHGNVTVADSIADGQANLDLGAES